jgi:hypothetical protein
MPAPVQFQNAMIVAGDSDFVFRPFPRLSFRILQGREIWIACGPDVAENDVRAFLIGSALGVLWHQRGLIPLHCSAVGLAGRAFAFTGASGAGKSTLAAGLSRRGLPHFCDDVCVFDPAAERLLIHAMPKELKLLRDAAETFGLPRGERVSTLTEKYYVAPPQRASEAPLRLAALYVLHDSPDAACRIEPLTGAAQFQELLAGVYRNEWLSHIRDPGEMFRQLAALACRIRLFRFSRPRQLSRFDESAERLHAHMAAIARED